MAWLNSDGLNVKYSREEATSTKGGEYRTYGPLQISEYKLTLTDYAITTVNILSDANFPKAYFEQLDVLVNTVPTSAGSPTLDFGLIRSDRVTELDYDGFVAAVAMTALDSESGTRRTYLSEATDSIPLPAAGGALLGTLTTNVGLPVVRVNTAVYTAGVITLRLHWRPA